MRATVATPMLAVLVAAACSDRKPDPAPSPPPATPKPAVDARVVDAAAPPKPTFCDRLDVTALAKSIGATPLTLVDESGVSGNVDAAPMWVCEYYEIAKAADGVQLMITIDGDAKLDTRPADEPQPNPDHHVTWRRFDGLGKPAAIGNAKYFTELQVVSNHVTVETHVGVHRMVVADRERLAVAAMKALLPQLPEDASTDIYTKRDP